MMFRYASFGDKLMWWLAALAATLFGGALPGFCIIFGDLIQDVGAQQMDNLTSSAVWMTVIGVIAALFSATFIALFSLFAVSATHKIQIQYFRAALKKDATYYDLHNTNQMSAKIAKECSAICRGSGDKTGLIIYALSTFVTGFAAAFFLGWWMSVLLLAMVPILAITGAGFGLILGDTMKEQMRAYAQSAGYAEQALTAIKVVHTYGQELLEMKNYNKYLQQAKSVGKTQALKKAVGNSVIITIFFFFYAYTFYVGALLRFHQVEMSKDKVYTGGAIVAIMFCIVFGGFSVGSAGPPFVALTEGKVAGKMAFDVIDQKPGIETNDPSKTTFEKEKHSGDLTLSNVTFRYPTKTEVPQIQDLSLTFKRGETTALVGESGSGKSTVIQLLERFYDPEVGTVAVNGQDIKSFNLNSFRRSMGYVS